MASRRPYDLKTAAPAVARIVLRRPSGAGFRAVSYYYEEVEADIGGLYFGPGVPMDVPARK